MGETWEGRWLRHLIRRCQALASQAWLARERAVEQLQFVEVDVGHRPEFETCIGPAHQAVAIMFRRNSARQRQRPRRLNEDIDGVETPFVDDHRDLMAIDIVKSPSDQREALWRQFGYRRCEVD